MSNAVQYGILGLGSGAIYALLALGLVLIFRGSGVLNLAHGAFAMLGGYLFHSLNVTRGWSVAPAMVATILIVMGIGAATDQVVLRNLRKASPLTRLIATIGVLLLIQSVAFIIWGQVTITVLPLIQPHAWFVHGILIPSDRIFLLAITVAVTILLTLFWRYTRAGWVTEAVSENEVGAGALGWSPEFVSAATWAAGTGLAALAGILVTPITQLDVVNLTLIVIAALAAALLGGFRSFPLTLAGGLFIGIAQSEASFYVHVYGGADAIPFLVVVAVLVLRGSALPLRGHVSDRLPAVGSGKINYGGILAAVVAALALLLLLGSSPNALRAIIATGGIATILLSLVVLTGYAGQVSLAQYALAGLGALVAAQLVGNQGWPFLLALPAGVLVATGVGLVFALPALRTRGVNLAVATLGLGLAVDATVFKNISYAGGPDGIDVGSPTLFGWNMDPFAHPQRYAGFTLGVFAVAAIFVARVRRGTMGRRFLAVRSNENAAAAAGVNVFVVKLQAFCIAGALAGLGGILIGFQAPAVTFQRFDPIGSLNAVALGVIGSIGYVVGPLVGALFAPQSIGSLLALHWQGLVLYLPIVGSAGLLIILLSDPDGLVSLNLKAARAEVNSKLAYLRFEVVILMLLAKLNRRIRARFGWTRVDAESVVLAFAKTTPVRAEPKTLRVENLTVRYGGVVAVDGVTLEVRPGEVVGLIGPNGAGKTSFMDAVSGFTKPAGGTVTLNGESMAGWSAHRRVRAGLVRSFQGLELFSDLTVLENVQVASERSKAARAAGTSDDGLALAPAAAASISEFGLAPHLNRRPDELSYGARRLLAIARAVASQPSVLLLDEPVSGLSDHESAEFVHLVRRLASEWGMAVMIVEHDMNFVMGVCDRIEVIDFGMPIASGTPDQVRTDPAAIAAYLGEEVPADELSDSTVVV